MGRVLVTGAGGLLGAHVAAALAPHHDVVGVDRHPWWGDVPLPMVVGDLAEPAIRTRAMAQRPDLLVHCAASVNVDACEGDEVRAYTDNAQVTRELVRAAPAGCRMVYISTDGLFDGRQPFATEETLPRPRTVYARSKLHGEWEVALASERHLIVRTNFYGWSSGRKKTFAEWLYQSLAGGEPITLFEDFFFTPLYVGDLVERLLRLMEADARGLFHVAGRDRVSKFEFGRLMADAGGFSMARVRRGRLADAGLPAPRPRDMSLSSERFCRLAGQSVPGCREGIQRFLADRGRPLSQRMAQQPLAAAGR